MLPLDTNQKALLNGLPQLKVTPSVEKTPLTHEAN